jgi:hypothetical protein
MGYTKRAFVMAAFSELGLASSEFDLQPDQIAAAGDRLDAMMAEWDGRGIHVGYPITSPTTIDLDAQTSVPAWANEAVICNLAIRLAPSYGRSVMAETRATAKNAYNTCLARTTSPPLRRLPNTLPVGAGNKPWEGNSDPFFEESTQLLVGDEGELTFE